MKYPIAIDLKKVGTYPALAKTGGGGFYDYVLEYRVWIHPKNEDVYYRPFATYEDALFFSKNTDNAELPLALVYQKEHINEPTPGNYIHIKTPRITEWKVEWLTSKQGTKENIPIFLKEKLKKK